MEDERSFINQWMAAAFDHDNDHLQHSLLYEDHDQLPINKSTPSPEDYLPNNRPTKQLKSNSWGSCIIEPTPSPEPHYSFSASNNNSNAAAASSLFYPPSPPGQLFTLDISDHHPVWNRETRTTSAGVRNPVTRDHVIAERKRREKLNQKFIALSAVVPGLKKASVLTEAIKYLKNLQERVKTLEGQAKSKSVESVVLVKKSKLIIDGEIKPFANDSLMKGEPADEEVPEIEVRVCNKDVLIRVHCDNKKGVIEKVIGEISKLNLTINNTSVLKFGSSALDITVVAQMDAKCCMTAKELVKTLRGGFMSFM